MAVYGLGSHDEPIVLSDDEDATHVENELNRWNGSSASSSNSSPVVLDNAPHGLYRTLPQPSLAPPSAFTPITSKQKRKRQESANSGMPSHAPIGTAEKRTKKKQKARQDATHPAKQTRTPSFKYEPYIPPEHHWPNARAGVTSISPPYPVAVAGYPPMQHAALPAVHSSTSWMSDTGRGRADTLYAAYPPFSRYEEAGPSWSLAEGDAVHLPSLSSSPTLPQTRSLPPRQPTTGLGASSSASVVPPSRLLPPLSLSRPTLDDSLRRLEALTANLVAGTARLSTVAPAKTVAPPRATAPLPAPAVPVDTDKRRIGNLNDKMNAATFDLHSPTLLSPPTSTLPPPVRTRTVVVAHLPKRFRDVDFVTTWAERFGAIARLELDVKPGKALVEYYQSAHAKAAFSSFKLRGEGKEHIRVYWYKASPAPPSAPVTRSSHADVEEGEIEEGEVVEAVSAPVPPKTKKKKGKKKAQPLEQRFTDPALPLPLKLQPKSALAAMHAAPLPVSPPRPSLEERFSDAPALSEGVWEEEMEMGSEDDYRPRLPSPGSPQLLATLIGTTPEEADPEDWEADMDVEASSPIRELSPPRPPPVSPPRRASPAPSRPRSLKRPRALSPLTVEEQRPSPAASTAEARRKALESIAPSRVPPAPSSGTSAPSAPSSGTSATPEPVTPSEVVDDPAVMVGGVASSETVAQDLVLPSVTKSDKGTVSLEDLAVSFITESIQAVAAPKPLLPAVLRPVPPKPSLPPKPPSLPQTSQSIPPPLHIPLPSVPSPTMVPSAPSTPQLSGKAQLLAKKIRLEEHIAASKLLLAQIGVAKTKAEKDKLMRLLKERQRAMDTDLQGGHASPSTPVPATPTPTPKVALFRWPETAHQLIIDISDDEADFAR